MSDSYGFSDSTSLVEGDLQGTIDKTTGSTNALGVSIGQFSTLITRAFSQAVTGGKQFDDVLKNVALSLSKLAVQSAFKSVTQGISGSVEQSTGGALSITPFATGGVIGAPSYFPMSGGLGLAGEAGPEAIMPLSRGPDGRLGIASGTGAAANITVQIATPDAGSFRRSEAYLTGQIARAVSRGQRNL
ncbi:phage tail tape measure protein [Pseudolabrys sp. FHR47]|uniref:phage tail tape measure protein n=1 Tax=Pseudolabrys sp. FHR47 TaxID=2562284 RepID=UPI0010BE8D27|nr:phage tail tape measure protein [Pseudolabrys sp. FHR47]